MRKPVDPSPETSAKLRQLGIRRRNEEAALAATRAETIPVVRRAIDGEGATPIAVGRLLGLHRTHIYRLLNGGK